MTKIDQYCTILEGNQFEWKEKNSKFLAFAFPIVNTQEADAILFSLRKEHSKANHVCYAYKLGISNDLYRINDDGEPSGTAGKPIYGQIISFGLTNIIVAVVRYFGGVKLGTTGLIQAYKQSSKSVLELCTIIEKHVTDKFMITTDYENMGKVLEVLKSLDIHIYNKEFTDHVYLYIELRRSITQDILLLCQSKLLDISLEEAKSLKHFNIYQITKL